MTKICRDCVHHTYMGITDYCTRRIQISEDVDVVTGFSGKVLKSGKYSNCRDERATGIIRRCGPTGKFYERGDSRITGIELAESSCVYLYGLFL